MAKDTWAPDGPIPDAALHSDARYGLGREVGRGGMGRVLVAHDAVLDRDVACKLLDRPTGAARFAREARLTARLDHPGIVPVYDAGELPDGTPFYTMRLLEGATLARRLEEPGDRLRHVDALIGATRAVAHAHQQRVVHRDLKPDNLVVGSLGDVQVVDWGIAVDLDEEPAPPVAGTPPYMSPEQAAGGPLAPTTDVYSLGLILWEILAGRPVRSTSVTPAEVAADRTPLPPVAPPELDAIARRATRPVPADRYPDAAALLEDLLAWTEGRRVSAHRYSPREELRRVLSAYKWPLGLVASVVAVGATVGAVTYAQVLAQRDAAEAAQRATAAVNRRLMLERAVQAAQSDDVLSALVWSAAVLDEAPDTGALGLQLRLRGQAPLAPGAILHGTADCVALHQDDLGLLCLTPEALRTDRWTVPASGRFLAVTPGLVGVWGNGSVTLFARDDGRELGGFEGRSPFFGDDGRIGYGRGREIVIAARPDDPEPKSYLTSSLVGGGWFTPDGDAHTWHADGTTSTVTTDGALTLEGGLSSSGVWTGAWNQGRFAYVDQVGLLRTWNDDPGDEGAAVGRAVVSPFAAGFVTVSRDQIAYWEGSHVRPRWTAPTIGADWWVANGRIYARPPAADWREWTAAPRRAAVGTYANGTRCTTPPSGVLVCAVGDRLVHTRRDGTARVVPLGERAAAPVLSNARVYGVNFGQVNVMDFEGRLIGVAGFDALTLDLRGHPDGAWLRTAGGELWFVDEQASTTRIPAPPLDQIESGGTFVVGRTEDGTLLWLDRSGATLASASVGDARPVTVEGTTGRVATWDGATAGVLEPNGPSRPLACRPHTWLTRDVMYCDPGAKPELVGLHGDRIPLLGTSSTIGSLTPEVRDGKPTGWIAVVYGDGTIGWMNLAMLRGSRSWTDDVRAETGFEVHDGALRFAPR